MVYPACSFVMRLPSLSFHDTVTAVSTSPISQVKVWETAATAVMSIGLMAEIFGELCQRIQGIYFWGILYYIEIWGIHTWDEQLRASWCIETGVISQPFDPWGVRWLQGEIKIQGVGVDWECLLFVINISESWRFVASLISLVSLSDALMYKIHSSHNQSQWWITRTLKTAPIDPADWAFQSISYRAIQK